MNSPKLDTRVPFLIPTALAFATALSLGGCALLGKITITGPGRTAARGGSPSPTQNADPATQEAGPATQEAGPATQEAAPPDPGAAENVVRYYQSLDYHHMSKYVDDTNSDLQAAGIRDRMLASSGNPDPDWIPGWDSLDRIERHMAMLRAAIRRTWSADCERDFNEFYGVWEEIRQAVESDLAAIEREPSYYVAADLLRKASNRVEELSVERDANIKNELSLSMVRAELARLELDLRARTQREGLAYFILYQMVLTHSRPIPEDSEQARALYCTYAAKTGTQNLRPIPHLRDINRLPSDAVRPLIDPRHDSVIAAWEKTTREWPLPNEGNREATILTDENAAPGQLTYVDYGGTFGASFVVLSIAEKSEGPLVKLRFSHTAKEQYGCRLTNRVAGITENGDVEYYEDCKERDVKYTYNVSATFTDPLPPQLEVGDELGFYADLEKLDASNKLKGKVRYRTIDAVVRGKHVRKIQRDGKVVAEY